MVGNECHGINNSKHVYAVGTKQLSFKQRCILNVCVFELACEKLAGRIFMGI